MYIEFNPTTLDVFQTIDIAITPQTGNKVIHTSVVHVDATQEEIEPGIFIPTGSKLTANVDDAKAMLRSHLRNIFDTAASSFISGGNTFKSNLEERVYTIGYLVSAQQSVVEADAAWRATRIDTAGTLHSLTAAEMIAHGKDMEASMLTAYTTYQTSLVALDVLTDVTTIYALV